MIKCSWSNKLSEGNEGFKSSECVRWKGVQLKRRAGSRQRHGKVVLVVISSSLPWGGLWPRAYSRPQFAHCTEGEESRGN